MIKALCKICNNKCVVAAISGETVYCLSCECKRPFILEDTNKKLLYVRVLVNNEFHSNHFTKDPVMVGSTIQYDYNTTNEMHIVMKDHDGNLFINIPSDFLP